MPRSPSPQQRQGDANNNNNSNNESPASRKKSPTPSRRTSPTQKAKKRHLNVDDEVKYFTQMSQSSWRPHSSVQTYYVAPRGRRGYFASLNDAINYAEPFSRIEVLTGNYFENVLVTKPMEIVSSVHNEEPPIFHSRGVTVLVQCECYIEGLHISTADYTNGVGIRVSIVGDPPKNIDGEKSVPKIFRCEIDCLDVVMDSQPIIEENRIVKSRRNGVQLLDRSGGLYKSNTIEHHDLCGVVVNSTGQSEFTHNKLSKSSGGQLLIHGKRSERDARLVAQIVNQTAISAANNLRNFSHYCAPASPPGSPENKNNNNANQNNFDANNNNNNNNNTVAENPFTAAHPVCPIFRYNRFSDDVPLRGIAGGGAGGGGGVGGTTDSSLASFRKKPMPVKQAHDLVCLIPAHEKNRAVDMEEWDRAEQDEVLDRRAAVEVYNDAQPLFESNMFMQSTGMGLRVHTGGKGEFRNNRFSQNKTFAATFEGVGTTPLFLDNTIQDNMLGGVRVRDDAAPILEGNNFLENRGPQLVVMRGCPNLKVLYNLFITSTRVGVVIKNNGCGHFIGNTFRDTHIAVRVESYSTPTFSSLLMGNKIKATDRKTTQVDRDEINRFQDCYIGIAATKYAYGSYHDLEFSGCRATAIMTLTDAKPTFTNCRFLANEHCVIAQRNGKGVFTACQFRDCHQAIVVIKDRGNPEFYDCQFLRGQDDGIIVAERGLGKFRNNFFSQTKSCHFVVKSRGDPEVVRNLMVSSGKAGIWVTEHGVGTFVDNLICANYGDGLLIENFGQPTVRNNVIRGNNRAGVNVGTNGDGFVEKNEIMENRGSNVVITGLFEATPVRPVTTSNNNNNNNNVSQDSTTLENTVNTNKENPSSKTNNNSNSPESDENNNNNNSDENALSSIANNINNNMNEKMMMSRSFITGSKMPPGFVVLRRNWLLRSRGGSVLCTTFGKCVMIENVLDQESSLGTAAIRVHTGGLIIAVKNEFKNGSGIYVGDEGHCCAFLNAFKNVEGPAIVLDTGSRPYLAWNTIEDCHVGVACSGGGSGALFENVINKCKHAAITCERFSRTHITGNVILGSGETTTNNTKNYKTTGGDPASAAGLMNAQHYPSEDFGNYVQTNSAAFNSAPLFPAATKPANNNTFDRKNSSTLLTNTTTSKSGGLVHGSSKFGYNQLNQNYQQQQQQLLLQQLQSNTRQQQKENSGSAGLVVRDKAKNQIRGNFFYGLRVALDCLGESLNHFNFSSNLIYKCTETGMILRGGSASIQKNCLLSNPVNILVDGDALRAGFGGQQYAAIHSAGGTCAFFGAPTVTDTIISRGVAIRVRGRGKGTFSRIVAQQCLKGLEVVELSTSPTVRDSLFVNCLVGAHFAHHGGGEMTSCVITRNVRNIVATSRASPTIQQCLLSEAAYFNATFDDGATGTLKKCVIQQAVRGGGIYCSGGARPVIELCVIRAHTLNGNTTHVASSSTLQLHGGPTEKRATRKSFVGRVTTISRVSSRRHEVFSNWNEKFESSHRAEQAPRGILARLHEESTNTAKNNTSNCTNDIFVSNSIATSLKSQGPARLRALSSAASSMRKTVSSENYGFSSSAFGPPENNETLVLPAHLKPNSGKETPNISRTSALIYLETGGEVSDLSVAAAAPGDARSAKKPPLANNNNNNKNNKNQATNKRASTTPAVAKSSNVVVASAAPSGGGGGKSATKQNNKNNGKGKKEAKNFNESANTSALGPSVTFEFNGIPHDDFDAGEKIQNNTTTTSKTAAKGENNFDADASRVEMPNFLSTSCMMNASGNSPAFKRMTRNAREKEVIAVSSLSGNNKSTTFEDGTLIHRVVAVVNDDVEDSSDDEEVTTNGKHEVSLGSMAGSMMGNNNYNKKNNNNYNNKMIPNDNLLLNVSSAEFSMTGGNTSYSGANESTVHFFEALPPVRDVLNYRTPPEQSLQLQTEAGGGGGGGTASEDRKADEFFASNNNNTKNSPNQSIKFASLDFLAPPNGSNNNTNVSRKASFVGAVSQLNNNNNLANPGNFNFADITSITRLSQKDKGGFRGTGIAVENGGRPLITKCRIIENNVGLLIRNRGNPEVHDCTFEGNLDHGLVLLPNASGKLNACSFRRNGVFQVLATGTGIRSFMTQCQIGPGAQEGFRAEFGATPRLQKCVFVGCSDCGIMSTHHACPRLFGCLFQQCSIGALVVAAGGFYKECKFEEIHHCGALMEQSSAVSGFDFHDETGDGDADEEADYDANTNKSLENTAASPETNYVGSLENTSSNVVTLTTSRTTTATSNLNNTTTSNSGKPLLFRKNNAAAAQQPSPFSPADILMSDIRKQHKMIEESGSTELVPEFQNCRFTGCSIVGARVTSEADAMFSENHFTKNGIGLEVSEGSHAEIMRNRFYENQREGLVISSESTADVTRNFFTKNKVAEIAVRLDSAPRILENVITESEGDGILFVMSVGHVNCNRIFKNRGNGIVVRHEATNGEEMEERLMNANGSRTNHPSFGNFSASVTKSMTVHPLYSQQQNMRRRSSMMAGFSASQAPIVFSVGGNNNNNQDNNNANNIENYYDNNLNNIMRGESKLSVKGNYIYENSGFGVVVTDVAPPIISCNSILHNYNGGILVENEATPEISHNFIKFNRYKGIHCTNMSRPRISSNVVSCTSSGPCISVETSAVPTIVNNCIVGGADGGLRFGNKARGTALSNVIAACTGAGIVVSGKATPSLQHNSIFDCDIGIHVVDGGAGFIIENYFTGQFNIAGIYVDDKCTPRVERCVIHDLYRCPGIVDLGNATFEKVVILGSAIGVDVRGGSSTFSEMHIVDCVFGVRIADGNPRIEQSTIGHSQRIGVVVEAKVFDRRQYLSTLMNQQNQQNDNKYGGGGGGSETPAMELFEPASATPIPHPPLSSNNNLKNHTPPPSRGQGRPNTTQTNNTVTNRTSPSTAGERDDEETNAAMEAFFKYGGTFVKTRIFHTKTGVQIEGGQTKFENCDVYWNLDGVVLSSAEQQPEAAASNASPNASALENMNNTKSAPSSSPSPRNNNIHNNNAASPLSHQSLASPDWLVTRPATSNITNCNIYDNHNIGLWLKSGDDLIKANYIFDNGYASCMVDGGAFTLEDNKLCFEKDGGALVLRGGSQGTGLSHGMALTAASSAANLDALKKVTMRGNVERNKYPSPQFEKSLTDRKSVYLAYKQDGERNNATFKRALKLFEAFAMQAFAATLANFGWWAMLTPVRFLAIPVCSRDEAFGPSREHAVMMQERSKIKQKLKLSMRVESTAASPKNKNNINNNKDGDLSDLDAEMVQESGVSSANSSVLRTPTAANVNALPKVGTTTTTTTKVVAKTSPDENKTKKSKTKKSKNEKNQGGSDEEDADDEENQDFESTTNAIDIGLDSPEKVNFARHIIELPDNEPKIQLPQLLLNKADQASSEKEKENNSNSNNEGKESNANNNKDSHPALDKSRKSIIFGKDQTASAIGDKSFSPGKSGKLSNVGGNKSIRGANSSTKDPNTIINNNNNDTNINNNENSTLLLPSSPLFAIASLNPRSVADSLTKSSEQLDWLFKDLIRRVEELARAAQSTSSAIAAANGKNNTISSGGGGPLNNNPNFFGSNNITNNTWSSSMTNAILGNNNNNNPNNSNNKPRGNSPGNNITSGLETPQQKNSLTLIKINKVPTGNDFASSSTSSPLQNNASKTNNNYNGSTFDSEPYNNSSTSNAMLAHDSFQQQGLSPGSPGLMKTASNARLKVAWGGAANSGSANNNNNSSGSPIAASSPSLSERRKSNMADSAIVPTMMLEKSVKKEKSDMPPLKTEKRKSVVAENMIGLTNQNNSDQTHNIIVTGVDAAPVENLSSTVPISSTSTKTPKKPENTKPASASARTPAKK